MINIEENPQYLSPITTLPQPPKTFETCTNPFSPIRSHDGVCHWTGDIKCSVIVVLWEEGQASPTETTVVCVSPPCSPQMPNFLLQEIVTKGGGGPEDTNEVDHSLQHIWLAVLDALGINDEDPLDEEEDPSDLFLIDWQAFRADLAKGHRLAAKNRYTVWHVKNNIEPTLKPTLKRKLEPIECLQKRRLI